MNSIKAGAESLAASNEVYHAKRMQQKEGGTQALLTHLYNTFQEQGEDPIGAWNRSGQTVETINALADGTLGIRGAHQDFCQNSAQAPSTNGRAAFWKP